MSPNVSLLPAALGVALAAIACHAPSLSARRTPGLPRLERSAGRPPQPHEASSLVPPSQKLWHHPTLAPGARGPVTAVASLARSAVLLGEPFVVNYRLTNRGSQSVYLDLGPQKTDWLAVTMTNAAGEVVAAYSDPVPPPEDGYQTGRNFELLPGESHRGQLVASQHYRLTAAGTYQLFVNVQLPYRIDGQPELALLATQATLSLTVNPPDARRLQAKAELLRIQALREEGVAARTALLESLFSMPETYALPSWQALVNDRSACPEDRIYVTDLLRRAGTPAAGDLLDTMWSSPREDPDVRALAKAALNNLYWAGDAALRRHLESAFAAHNEPPPNYGGPIVAGD